MCWRINWAEAATTLPVLGTNYVGTVDLAGTTGHALAWLAGYAVPATITLSTGQTLLMDITHPAGELLLQPLKPGPIATYTIPVPLDPALCGAQVAGTDSRG